jgi:hypothetical protein
MSLGSSPVRLTLGALALAISLLMLAPPVPAARSASETSLTIRLISTVASLRAVDLPPKRAPNKGDVFYVRSVLRNGVAQFGHPKGAVVGTDFAVLRFLSARMALLNVDVDLPGGTLRLRGKADAIRTTNVLPVVGGTGRFANARGTSEVRDKKDRSINIYRLRLP